MPDINELDLIEEPVGDVDFEKLRTQSMGMRSRPPQPGIYVFRLPSADALRNAFELVNDPQQGQRLRLVLRDEAALQNETLGETYSTSITNVTRIEGKEENQMLVSDIAKLLKVVGEIPQPNAQGHVTNRSYADAVIRAAGKAFKGETTLTANCGTKRDIYRAGAVQQGVKGCGLNYAVDSYTKKTTGETVIAIPKELGEGGKHLVSIRFECACGAELTCFSNLRGFKAVKE